MEIMVSANLIVGLIGLISAGGIVTLFRLYRTDSDVSDEEYHNLLTEMEDADGTDVQNEILDRLYDEIGGNNGK